MKVMKNFKNNERTTNKIRNMDFTELKKGTREIIDAGNNFADLVEAFEEKYKDFEITEAMQDLAMEDPEMVQLQIDLNTMAERIQEGLGQ